MQPAPAQSAPASAAAPLPHTAPLRLRESLQQLQGEAAFATRPAPLSQTSPLAPPAQTALTPPPLPTPTTEQEPFIEGLTDRRLFVRLPELDPVQLLLERYVPPEQRPQRDLSGDYHGKNLDALIIVQEAHDWRGVARYSYDAITQSPPELTSHILSHWLLRFHALLRLRLLPALAAELANVFVLLPPTSCISPIPAPDLPLFHPGIPFELHLLAATLPSLVPDGSKTAAVEALAALLTAAKREMWRAARARAAEEERAWRERVERAAGVLGAVMGEMKATTAQRALMTSATNPPSALLAALARHHYTTGDVAALAVATSSVSEEASARRAKVLEHVARAEWPDAERELRALVQADPDDLEAHVNLAVVLLYSSARLDEATSILTDLLAARPHAGYHAPALLFNLCTLHELRLDAPRAAVEKIRLLVGAAAHGAQGIDAATFKLAL